MRQNVLFRRAVALDNCHFQAGQDYCFTIRDYRRTRWLYFGKQRLITLSYFTNIVIDQGHAVWVDEQVRVA